MPWQEVSIVDQRREFVRLAMQEFGAIDVLVNAAGVIATGTLEATLSEWADRCHEEGGLVVLPHFPHPNGETAALVATGRADAVEQLTVEFCEHTRLLPASVPVHDDPDDVADHEEQGRDDDDFGLHAAPSRPFRPPLTIQRGPCRGG